MHQTLLSLHSSYDICGYVSHMQGSRDQPVKSGACAGGTHDSNDICTVGRKDVPERTKSDGATTNETNRGSYPSRFPIRRPRSPTAATEPSSRIGTGSNAAPAATSEKTGEVRSLSAHCGGCKDAFDRRVRLAEIQARKAATTATVPSTHRFPVVGGTGRDQWALRQGPDTKCITCDLTYGYIIEHDGPLRCEQKNNGNEFYAIRTNKAKGTIKTAHLWPAIATDKGRTLMPSDNTCYFCGVHPRAYWNVTHGDSNEKPSLYCCGQAPPAE